MKKLTVLVGLVVALALALPGSANAVSFSEVKKLTASDALFSDLFGGSVGVSGDSAIVGARGDDAAGILSGAAYLFERNEGGLGDWGQVIKLTASDAQAGDWFGFHVAVSGDTAVVGADRESSRAGAAYVFERNQGGPGNWGEVRKLTASDAQVLDQFGISVAVNGDTAVVGADRESISTGAAYVFARNEGGPGNWGEVIKLTASDAQVGDAFGFSVATSADTAILGALGR